MVAWLKPLLGFAGALITKPKRVSGQQSTLEAAAGAIQAQEQYGINALELVRSGASSAAGTLLPKVGSVTALMNSFDSLSDVLTGREAQRLARERVETDLAKIELDLAKARLDTVGRKVPHSSTRYITPKVGSASAMKKYHDQVTRPKARPTAETTPRQPVNLPDGSQAMIPSDVAQRLDIKPFGNVMPGDYAELVGELRGEGETAASMVKVGRHMGIPVLGSSVTPPPPEMENPARVPDAFDGYQYEHLRLAYERYRKVTQNPLSFREWVKTQ